MNLLYLIPLVIASAAQAQGAKPPACFDTSTIAFVKRAIHQDLPGEVYRQLPRDLFDRRVSLENAVAETYAPDIQRFDCSATLIVESSQGLDKMGQMVVTSPQLLASAGVSVAEVERVVATDLSSDRTRFSYKVRFSSQLAGARHHVAVEKISELRRFMTASFVAASVQSKN